MYNKFVKLGTSAAVAILALLMLGTLAQAQQVTPEPVANNTALVLTPAEQAGLVFMREEEKLAHDVYTVLYAKWGVPIFNNIARSESQHTSAVKALLDRYGIPDPTVGKAPGQFTNPQLQALYDQLVASGSKSVQDALRVGVIIEETDIADLKTHVGESTRWDIQRVYSNLLRGSQNHLRAFQRQLS